MSEIYHWFVTSGQSPVSCFGRWYISEHAQKPIVFDEEWKTFSANWKVGYSN